MNNYENEYRIITMHNTFWMFLVMIWYVSHMHACAHTPHKHNIIGASSLNP